MSALKEMMTQEDAMNMSNEQAIQILIPMRNMMCDQNGCPISDAVFALDKAIKSLSADVAPVRHGQFVPFEEVFMDTCWECSECGLKFYLADGGTPKENSYNYCPNCGARMDGDDNEID